MDKYLVFDRSCSMWSKNHKANVAYIHAAATLVMDYVRVKSYCTLVSFAAMLGIDSIKIDPCLGWDEEHPIEYSVDEPDNDGGVKIWYKVYEIF